MNFYFFNKVLSNRKLQKGNSYSNVKSAKKEADIHLKLPLVKMKPWTFIQTLSKQKVGSWLFIQTLSGQKRISWMDVQRSSGQKVEA